MHENFKIIFFLFWYSPQLYQVLFGKKKKERLVVSKFYKAKQIEGLMSKDRFGWVFSFFEVSSNILVWF